MKRICWYLQGTKDNGLVFNPPKNWWWIVILMQILRDGGNENPQEPICSRSTTGFVVTFSNCTILWVSKLHTEIAIFTLHSEYVVLSHSVRALLPLKSLIKEVIENLGIDSKKLKFLSRSTTMDPVLSS